MPGRKGNAQPVRTAEGARGPRSAAQLPSQVRGCPGGKHQRAHPGIAARVQGEISSEGLHILIEILHNSSLMMHNSLFQINYIQVKIQTNAHKLCAKKN